MSEWITDRLPNEFDLDVDGDVLTPCGDKRKIDWRQAYGIKLGDPWLPAPPIYVKPKTREDLVQDLLDAIDKWKETCLDVDAASVRLAREKLL